jgi:hypothetical protein
LGAQSEPPDARCEAARRRRTRSTALSEKLLADAMLDNAALKDLLAKKW